MNNTHNTKVLIQSPEVTPQWLLSDVFLVKKMLRPRTPIRSPPAKKTKPATCTPKKLQFGDEAWGDQTWQGSWWDGWNGWAGQGYGRRWSWQDYDKPVCQTLFERQPTPLPHERGEAADAMAVDEPKQGEPDLEAPHGRVLEADNAAGPVAVKPATGAVGKMVGDGPGKAWNLDKYGNPLTSKALYQRFYRQIRRL